LHESDEENTHFASNYNYDPQLASDELGLPIDLIEEFVQDFIAQTQEFKEQLYVSLNRGHLDELKTLSHKLKGVAANLRIEDAFNALNIINNSKNSSDIEIQLNIFYKIIEKLSEKYIK